MPRKRLRSGANVQLFFLNRRRSWTCVLYANAHRSYHELLCASTAAAVSAALRHDSLGAYEIGTDGGSELRELVEDLGLPANTTWWAGGEAGDGGGGRTAGAGLTLPLVLPFTRCVPVLLRLLRSFVTDSLAFLKGLASPWELLQAVFHHRDRWVSIATTCQAVKLPDPCCPGSYAPVRMKKLSRCVCNTR